MSDNSVWIPSDQTKCHHSMWEKDVIEKNNLFHEKMMIYFFNILNKAKQATEIMV